MNTFYTFIINHLCRSGSYNEKFLLKAVEGSPGKFYISSSRTASDK